MKTKHTPLKIDNYFPCDILSKDMKTICSTVVSDFDDGEKLVNAALIVKAVNLHDELVEALESIGPREIVIAEGNGTPRKVINTEDLLLRARGES